MSDHTLASLVFSGVILLIVGVALYIGFASKACIERGGTYYKGACYKMEKI